MTPPIESSITPANVKNLTDEELSIAAEESKRRIAANFTQSVESTEKIPELEIENYKIDKTLSLQEKLQNGRTKETDLNGIVYLRKDLGDGAYVREFFDGNYKGEQKFNRAAVQSLGLQDKLPKNYEEFKKIRGENHQDFMQKYFSKNNKLFLSGSRYPRDKKFNGMGGRENFWLGNGASIGLQEHELPHESKYPQHGFSVRLIKA
ncbi:MAG: hypothetical protein WAZ12_00585 [Candidatus Absconditicoccaceae bacterium]